MDLGLSGLNAIVTGASKGLGFATALELLKEGANVVINSRDENHLEAAAKKLSDENIPQEKFFTIAGDVTDQGFCQDLISRSEKNLGGIDILVTNSGGPPAGTFEEISMETWEHAINLSFMSHVYLIKQALPFLKQAQFPSVLGVTSFTVKYPLDNLILSNTVRAATAALIKSLSIELGEFGIRCNSILPGWTMTDRVNHLLQVRADMHHTSIAAEQQKITEIIPLQRMGTPSEFAKAAAFLVSPAASFITGIMLPVEGGITRGLF